MNSAWDAWVPQGHTPARATVEAKLAAPQYKVEIQVIAAAVIAAVAVSDAGASGPARGRRARG